MEQPWPEDVAHFLDRILFCLFAEDAGLLPKGILERLSLAAKGRSQVLDPPRTIRAGLRRSRPAQ